MNRNEGFSPFFIVGSGRSGSTLVRRILNAHSKLFVPPETYVIPKAFRLFKQLPAFSWRDLVCLIYSQYEFRESFDDFDIPSLRDLAMEISACDKPKRSLALIIASFYQFYAELHGIEKPLWGDKTPMYSFHLNKLVAIFPDARFIHIIRDGCDVVYSYKNTGFYNVEDAAKRWRLSVENVARFGKTCGKCYIEVKYEDLVTYPTETVKKLCRFLEVEFEEDILRSESTAATLGDVPKRAHHQRIFEPIDTSSIGLGRYNLTTIEKEIVRKVLKRSLRKFGYEPCD